MKQIGWSTLLALTITLTACGSSTPAVLAPATPALTEVPTNVDVPSDIVIASAEIVPAQVSYIGFTISALVKEVAVKEGDMVQAGQTLVVLETPDLEFAVVAADAAFRSAQAEAEIQDANKVKVIKNGKTFFENLPHEVQLVAETKAQQAKAALEIAQANLVQATLVAPYDGTVVSINIIPGELAQVDQPVLTLANLNSLQIETTDLSERDIPHVQIGQAVNVYIEALAARVTGKVIRISPISDIVGGDIVYSVTIELDEQPDGLLWGMTAEVEIQTTP